MFRRCITGVAVVGVLALGASACGSSNNNKPTNTGSPTSAATSPATTNAATTPAAAPSSAASGGGSADAHGGVTLATSAPLATTQGKAALVVENNPIPSLEDNFNAFNGNGFGYKLNAEGLFYEPLLMFNDLKPNTAYPWLATDFAWNSDGTQLTFTIRDNVKFSDGTTLTADDVAYTFQVMVDNPKMNRAGLPLVSAKATDAKHVTVTFKQPQFQNLFTIAGQTFIVEKKAYSAQSDPAGWADPKPVGTGPYTLDKFSAQGLTFKANPNYWGGTPPVPEVDIPSFSSNDVALQQLAAGKIDYAGNFVSQIQQSFVAKDPAHNKYWFPSINVVNLVFNVTTGPAALQDVAVRKAISAALDRSAFSTQAEQGYEPVATSSSGLLLPNFQSYLPSQYANDLKATPDLATVTTLMTGAGYAKDGKGIWAKGGKEVSFNIEDPSAYTDYYQGAQIFAANLKAAGFDAKADGVDANKWYADLAAGTFDTAIHWSNSGPNPYATYDGWVDSALAQGNNRTGDYGGFKDASADQALADYAKASTTDQATAAVATLAKVVSEQVPVTPIAYAAGWYEYNTKNYSGWVDKDNQYMDPAPNPAGVAYVILHLKPNS